MILTKNVLKTAFRNIAKYKSYTLINFLGLSIGIACSILVTLFVLDELSYDDYHSNKSSIYRIVESRSLNGTETNPATTPIFLGKKLQEIDELNGVVRFLRDPNGVVKFDDKSFQESNFCFTDPDVFDVFDIQLIAGNKEKALNHPTGMILSETAAKKYFGNEDPINQTLTYRNWGRTYEYIVTGIYKDIPRNSHFRFDIMVPFESENNLWNAFHGTDWYYSGAWTYVQLADKVHPSQLEQKLEQLITNDLPDDLKTGITFSLQPLADIYLTSDLSSEIQANGSLVYVRVFGFVAVLILFIACINFINLSTARVALRTKEVGMRKVMGASRSSLMAQFMGETLMITLAASFLAIFIIWIALPEFNVLTGKELAFDRILAPSFIVTILFVGILTGFISGIYPAFVVSQFKPIQVLKANNHVSLKGANIRRVLVIIQFTISIILISSILTIFRQVQYIQNAELGFDQNQILYSPWLSVPDFKNAMTTLSTLPGVKKISGGTNVPGNTLYESLYRSSDMNKDQRVTAPSFSAHYDYINLLKLEIIEGRNFGPAYNDPRKSCLVNEAMVKQLNWINPIGEQLYTFNMIGAPADTLQVVGVVKDFNYQSLHHQIRPLVIRSNNSVGRLIVEMQSENLFDDAERVEAALQEYAQDVPLEISFLSTTLQQLYQKEKTLSKVMFWFALIAILISCLGLLGLASYTINQKTREIGIRKVLGASIGNVLQLFSKEYVRVITVSTIVAIPLSYVGLENWLSNFAFRIPVDVWVFVLSIAITVFSAIATIGFHSIRAAKANPIDSLKEE